MAEITAGMVKELREATGLGMMDCKKALVETDGDFKAAEELLRIKSGAKASKAASRVAAEGVVSSFVTADGKIGSVVEVNCETDFVAKNDDFVAFANSVAQTVAMNNPVDVDALSNLTISGGSGTVEEARKALVMKLGENIPDVVFRALKHPASWLLTCMAARLACCWTLPVKIRWAKTWLCTLRQASQNRLTLPA